MGFKETYLASVGQPEGDPALEAQLDAILSAAQARWPALEVPAEEFARFLGARVGRAGAPARLATEDLYLALACLVGAKGAAEALEAAAMIDVPEAVRRVRNDETFIAEVVSDVRVELLVGVKGRPPALTRYQGRGPLRSFVLVMAMRRGVDRTRGGRSERHANLFAELIELELPDTSVENQQIRRQLQGRVELAMKEALAALEPRARELLRQHVIEGVSAQDLAERHGVHRATATRWIASAKDDVLKHVRGRLSRDLDLTPAGFESLQRVLAQGVDLSLSTFIGE